MKEKKRVPQYIIAEDVSTMGALKTLSGYAPRNPEFSVEAIEGTWSQLAHLLHEERLNDERREALRAQIVLLSNRYHGQVLGGKGEAVTQFGNDSVEIEALGLKRKSERKPPRRKGEEKRAEGA
jgi:hypothetical protein